jgi:hypothetical protein
MGFGLLLIGYFTATLMSYNIFGAFFKLVGFSIAYCGIKKLRAYNECFGILLYSSVSMVAISFCCSLGNLSDFLFDNMLTAERIIPTMLSDVFTYVKYVLECIFTILLCISVCSIAKETGAPKLVYISVRNLVIYAVYFVLQVLSWIPSEAVRNFLSVTALPAWVLILNLLILVLNTLMLFSCYTKICDESDTEMPQKPSRFEFVNRMRAEKEERARERQKRFEKPKPEKPLQSDLYSLEQQQRSAASAKRKKKSK